MTPSCHNSPFLAPNTPDKYRSEAPEQGSKYEKGSEKKWSHKMVLKSKINIICHSGIFEPQKVIVVL
jgi:hypothetical protein